MVTKLHPSRIDNVRFTKSQYEFIAWSIRQVNARTGTEIHLPVLASLWADELKGTNVAFKRDRFISAVVNGEW